MKLTEANRKRIEAYHARLLRWVTLQSAVIQREHGQEAAAQWALQFYQRRHDRAIRHIKTHAWAKLPEAVRKLLGATEHVAAQAARVQNKVAALPVQPLNRTLH